MMAGENMGKVEETREGLKALMSWIDGVGHVRWVKMMRSGA
jgi:hypothetical protein